MGLLSSIFSNENRTRKDMENSLFVLEGGSKQGEGQGRGAVSSEKKILKDVFDIIEEVPEGKKLLNDVAKMGYKFHFQTNIGKVGGACYNLEKAIMLNPTVFNSAAEIATACYHEMVHAMQDKQLGENGKNASGLNMADQIRLDRAKEAAAYTEQAAFAYKIKDKHPEVGDWLDRKLIYSEYKKEMDKSGDMAKAAEKTFKAWYNCEDILPHYEKAAVETICTDINNACKGIFTKKPDRALFQGSLSAEEMVQAAFITKDARNGISPDYLKSKEANRLSEDRANDLRSLSKQCEQKFGYKDESLSTMNIVAKPKEEEKSKQSMMAALKQTEKETKETAKAEKPKESMMSTLMKTEQAQEKPSLMGFLAGIAADMAVGAAKHQAANAVKQEVMKAVKGNDR